MKTNVFLFFPCIWFILRCSLLIVFIIFLLQSTPFVKAFSNYCFCFLYCFSFLSGGANYSSLCHYIWFNSMSGVIDSNKVHGKFLFIVCRVSLFIFYNVSNNPCSVSFSHELAQHFDFSSDLIVFQPLPIYFSQFHVWCHRFNKLMYGKFFVYCECRGFFWNINPSAVSFSYELQQHLDYSSNLTALVAITFACLEWKKMSFFLFFIWSVLCYCLLIVFIIFPLQYVIPYVKEFSTYCFRLLYFFSFLSGDTQYSSLTNIFKLIPCLVS